MKAFSELVPVALAIAAVFAFWFGLNRSIKVIAPWIRVSYVFLGSGLGVRGRSKPATRGRIKTSQFEGEIIGRRPGKTGTLADERTQIEPATVNFNSA